MDLTIQTDPEGERVWMKLSRGAEELVTDSVRLPHDPTGACYARALRLLADKLSEFENNVLSS